MEATNQIRMHIEKDGTVSIDTDAFEEEMHLSAEQLINETCELLGGQRKVIEHKVPDAHSHTHIGGHIHSHG
jgi:hypothetical protein